VPASSELSLRWLTRPHDVPPILRAQLTACWREVVNAGGAVGFAEEVPVTEDDVAPAVDEIVAGLHPRLSRLLVAMLDGDLAGWLLLSGNADPVVAHWGRVTRLQTAVHARGSGVARALLTELHRSAQDDLDGAGPGSGTEIRLRPVSQGRDTGLRRNSTQRTSQSAGSSTQPGPLTSPGPARSAASTIVYA
jgi:hypothetical protein